MQTRPTARTRAFTLVELLVVVAIIALLVAILLPSLGAARRRANTSACLTNVRGMSAALITYVADWQRMVPFTGSTTDSWTQVLQKTGAGGGYGLATKNRLCREASSTVSTDPRTVPWWGANRYAWGNSPETGNDPFSGLPLVASYGINGFLYNAMPARAISTVGGTASRCYSVPVSRRDSEIPAFADCIWRHVFPSPTDKPGANLENPGPDSYFTHPISKLMLNRHNRAINVSFLDGHASTTSLPDLYRLYWSSDWVVPTAIPPIPQK